MYEIGNLKLKLILGPTYIVKDNDILCILWLCGFYVDQPYFFPDSELNW